MFENLPTLYKLSNNGKVEEWTIFYSKDTASFYTVSGQLDGVKTTSLPTFCLEKNINKSNYRTPGEQAFCESTAKWEKQIDKGYTPELHNVMASKKFQVMLAQSYTDNKKTFKWPLYVQPKLDGVRCRANKDGLWTRNNNRIVSCPHIESALLPYFQKHPNSQLDGELYNHNYHDDFPALISYIKKANVTSEVFSKTADLEKGVQYHVYDTTEPAKSFSLRYLPLLPYFEKTQALSPVKTVLTKLAYNHNDILNYHDEFYNQGYEGVMIRTDSFYENKRSWNLLKYKLFNTEEFQILSVHEGTGNKSKMVASVDISIGNGVVCSSNVKGSHEFLSDLFIKKDSLIGSFATIKFQGYTPDGSLRFPYLVAIRDYE
jgi:DNA ligase-1